MDPKATEPIPGIQIEAPHEPPVPVPLRPKPQIAPEPTYSPDAYSSGKMGPIGKTITVVLIILALLVLGTTAGAVYMYTASGDAVVAEALSVVDSARKIHLTARLEPDAEEGVRAGTYLELTNAIDRTGASVRAQSQIVLKWPNISASAEGRYIDSVVYGKINSMPEAYKMYLGEAANRWYSVSLDTLKAAAGARGFAISSSTIHLYTSPSKIYTILTNAHVLNEPSFTGIKNTPRGLVREYTMLIDKDALANYILTSGQLEEVQPGNAESKQKAVKDGLEKILFRPVLIRTSLISGNLLDVEVGLGITQSLGGISGVTLTLSNDESKTNFSVSIPENVTPLDEMVLSSLQMAKERELQSRIISSLVSVRGPAEAYYQKAKSYVGMCTKDAQISGLFAQIKGEGATVTCKATARAYLAAARLPQAANATSTIFFCIDSTGIAKPLAKIPTGYICK